MASGGKKDATYIADIFAEKVEEYDPNHQLMNVFYFDGAANVQKAGQVLMESIHAHFDIMVANMLWHYSSLLYPKSSRFG